MDAALRGQQPLGAGIAGTAMKFSGPIRDAALIFAGMSDYAVPFSGDARSSASVDVMVAEGYPQSERKA